MRKRAAIAAVAALALGCKARHAAAPVAPAPVVAAAAEPLSAPQTAYQLPPPQPIPAEAIPTEPRVEERVTEPAPAPQSPRAAQRNRTPATVALPPPAPATAAPAPDVPGPQLRPMFTPAQERELGQSIDRSLAAAEKSLARAALKQSDQERYASALRVRAFIDQARQAQRQGDLNRALSLAERAELLASDLARAPQ